MRVNEKMRSIAQKVAMQEIEQQLLLRNSKLLLYFLHCYFLCDASFFLSAAAICTNLLSLFFNGAILQYLHLSFLIQLWSRSPGAGGFREEPELYLKFRRSWSNFFQS